MLSVTQVVLGFHPQSMCSDHSSLWSEQGIDGSKVEVSKEESHNPKVRAGSSTYGS